MSSTPSSPNFISVLTENKDGLALIDKPCGPSSFDMVKVVRQKSKIKKTGHAGTLDPFASGLLIIGIGRNYTKLLSTYQSLYKRYTGSIVLGIETNTLDAYGEITQKKSCETPTIDTINTIFNDFIGEQTQIAPAFSAKKHHGTPLYKLARKGMPIPQKTQHITIHELDCHTIEKAEFPIIHFSTSCSKGTYIRSLAQDIGKKLGTYAYTHTLRRTHIGDYDVQNAIQFSKDDISFRPPSHNVVLNSLNSNPPKSCHD